MPQRRHVDTNLVRAPGFNLQLEQSEFTVRAFNPPLNFVTRHRLTPAAAACGHTDAANGIAADRTRDRAVVALDPAMHQSNVRLLHPPAGELSPELAVGDIILGDNNQSARFLIEPVDNPGPK